MTLQEKPALPKLNYLKANLESSVYNTVIELLHIGTTIHNFIEVLENYVLDNVDRNSSQDRFHLLDICKLITVLRRSKVLSSIDRTYIIALYKFFLKYGDLPSTTLLHFMQNKPCSLTLDRMYSQTIPSIRKQRAITDLAQLTHLLRDSANKVIVDKLVATSQSDFVIAAILLRMMKNGFHQFGYVFKRHCKSKVSHILLDLLTLCYDKTSVVVSQYTATQIFDYMRKHSDILLGIMEYGKSKGMISKETTLFDIMKGVCK